MIAQEALSAARTDVQRLQKQTAASAGTAQKQQKLLEQLSAAEEALADSHSSAQKLLQQLSQSKAAHLQTQQQMKGNATAVKKQQHANLSRLFM